jgi:glyoxylase-like metal-dependent hydrolase (beta-lactamase superfamily II)
MTHHHLIPMKQQIPLDPAARADVPSAQHDSKTHQVTPDLAYQRLGIVNVVFVGHPAPATGRWVLIDAGIPGATGLISRAVAAHYGEGARPAAIVLTHGHFDHVGALENLAEEWQVPVFAHLLELPYLDGRASYPPPDPKAGGGIMSLMSPMFPRSPVDVSRWLQALPSDGSVPFLPEWRWIHTPGHTPGHVSLWREADRTIIAGDAFITTRQESAYSVAVQKPEMHGPPMYFTQDWQAARESVRTLATLQPELAVTGHGPAMRGQEMRSALQALALDFDEIAVPEHGRYPAHPVLASDGSAYAPA